MLVLVLGILLCVSGREASASDGRTMLVRRGKKYLKIPLNTPKKHQEPQEPQEVKRFQKLVLLLQKALEHSEPQARRNS